MPKVSVADGCRWFQTIVSLSARSRGCHDVTKEITSAVKDSLSQISIGVMHLSCMHTSASICLNECWDGDVRVDAEMALNKIVPENWPYRHTLEGSDDMPAHVKTALVGSSLTVQINNGELMIGTWQGIWLCEHRDRGGSRKIAVTIQGAPKS